MERSVKLIFAWFAVIGIAAAAIIPNVSAQPTTASVNVLSGTREPVLLATTGNIQLTGLQAIDGVVPAAGDRILVRAQTDTKLNGIYTTSPTAWRRSPDARDSRSITKGVVVRVAAGSTLANKTFGFQGIQPQIGTDAITLVEVLPSGDPILASAVVNDSGVSGTDAADALNNLDGRLDDLEATDTARTPVGSVVDYVGTTAPSGWIFAYGQCLSQTSYAAFYAVASTTYGGGCSVGQFRAPDLRGRVVAGQDDMGSVSANRLTGLTNGVNGDTLGGTGGEEAHTMLIAEMPAHRHLNVSTGTDTTLDANASIAFDRSQGNDFSYSMDGAGNTAEPSAGRTSSVGSGEAHNTVPPVIILNKIIYVGV